MRTPTGWYTPKEVSPNPSLTELVIQNTIYVAKNGNDSTGLPNRLDKPFLTIYEASLVANAGDTVYVFSGTYDEGTNDWVKSDVKYSIQDGVLIQNTSICIGDGGIAKNINIEGNGKFQSNLVVVTTHPDTILNISCNEIIANTQGFVISNNLNPFNIKFKRLRVAIGNGIILSGTSCTGLFEFDSIVSISEQALILINDCNTDDEIRNIYFKGKEIQVNLSSQALRNVLRINNNCNNTHVYFQVTQVIHQFGSVNLSSFVNTSSAYLYISNTNYIGENYGIRASGQSIVKLLNCNISVLSRAILIINDSNLFIQNCQLITDNPTELDPTGTIEIENNSEITAKNCTVVQKGAFSISRPIYIKSTSCSLRLASCILIGNILNDYSIVTSGSVPTDIYLEEDCSANLEVESVITNQIAGTNIVISSYIVQNNSNFF